MQSLHLNLNKILEEEDPEPNNGNKIQDQQKFYAKRGSAPDATLFELKSSSSSNNNKNNFCPFNLLQITKKNFFLPSIIFK